MQLRDTAFFLALAATFALSSPALAGPEEDQAHERAITWLAAQQNGNGSFGRIPRMKEEGELGITGLVVKALAGAPETQRKKHFAVAKRAAAWMLEHQQQDGSFTQPRSGMATYRTSIAIVALAALDKVAYKEAIARAAAFLTSAQWSEARGVKEGDPAYGGFGYGGKRERPGGDLSNTAMALAALKDAGLSPEDPVYKRALVFLTRCQNSSETNPGVGKLKPKEDGGFIYSASPGRNKNGTTHADGTTSFESYASMTYGGLMSLGSAGVSGEDDPRVKAALSWISEHYTLEENYGLGTRSKDPKAGQEGLYYYYYVFARCMGARGQATVSTKDGPRLWARDLFAAFKERQHQAGYFVNPVERWWEGDKTLVTAFVVTAMNEALPHLRRGK